MASEKTIAPSRDQIDQVLPTVIDAMAIRAALQLGLFTPLADAPMTAEELANAIDVDPRRLEMLLYQLVVSGYLEVADGKFTNTPMTAHYLIRGHDGYYGGIHEFWTEMFTALMGTADSIRTGIPQAKIDFAGMTQDELGAFLRGIHGRSVAAGRNIAKSPLFAEAKNVVDVGGGSGGVAIALCEAHPQLQVTVTDLPSVVPIAQEMIGEAGLANRITGLIADILADPLPGGFDVAVARTLFQVLSVEQCQQAAHNIAAALPSGGTLFIVGYVTDDSRLSPEGAVGMDTVFLNVFDDGQSYTESQYHSWLKDAGFTAIVRTPFLAGTSLITAQKS